jgi:hypothetical protein
MVLAIVLLKSCTGGGTGRGGGGGELRSGVSVMMVAFGSKLTVGRASVTSTPPSCVQNFCASFV